MKLLVMGFDGVDFQLFNEWFPGHFSDWKWQCRSVCESDFTPTAWTTFATGKQPAEHGVGIDEPRPGYMWTGKDIEFPTVIDVLKGTNLSIGVGHLPVVSLPCKKLNGWMCSGDFVWPYTQWPATLCDPYTKPGTSSWLDYVRYSKENCPTDELVLQNEQKLLDLILSRMVFHNQRFRSALSNHVPDVLFVYWHGTDLAGHHLYHREDMLRLVYTKMMDLIKDYVVALSPEGIFVVSDHGMQEETEHNRNYNGNDYWLDERNEGVFLLSGIHRLGGLFYGDGKDFTERRGDVDLVSFMDIYKDILGVET